MAEVIYRFYGSLHRLAKTIIGKSGLKSGAFSFRNIKRGCLEEDAILLWKTFIESSTIEPNLQIGSFHYAGYVAENRVWCLPSWIWTNATVVRLYCEVGEIKKAILLCDKLASSQQECGGWIVRNDYDSKGAIPILAPNDSAYIANNAFVSLYLVTKESKYLDIARKCADWIIETARPDGLVYTGYNVRDQKWAADWIIVDTGFSAGLFARLFMITGEGKYRVFLQSFIKRYIDLFYMPSKKGFCTSINKFNKPQGGMFARGQAWALEGLIPAWEVLQDDTLKTIILKTMDTLLSQQCKNGGWPYNLTRKMMGEDCKAVSVIAKDMMEWYSYTKDKRILLSAKRALEWCYKHTAIDGEAKGGIFSYCVEGAIVKDLYTSCAFVYASAYAVELKKQIENADNNTN